MKSFRGRESRAGTTQGESGLHLKGQRLTVHPHPEPRGTCLRSVTQQPGGSLPFGCLANKPLLSPGKTRQAGGGTLWGRSTRSGGLGTKCPHKVQAGLGCSVALSPSRTSCGSKTVACRCQPLHLESQVAGGGQANPPRSSESPPVPLLCDPWTGAKTRTRSLCLVFPAPASVSDSGEELRVCV